MGEESAILCRNCRHPITSVDAIISVSGSHRHVFTNPAGIVHEIGCFSDADGCSVIGEPTGEYTWFPGFRWSIAFCAYCMLHMGWFYQSGREQFFGLITANLVERMQTH